MIVGGLELEISGYTYTSERMAGPRLSAEIYSPECLDGLWTGDEHLRIVEGGEEIKLWLSGEPSSRKDNTDSRYIHSVEFVGYPERILGGVYFRDAVRDDASSVDKYQSGWYDIQFHGTLVEFVSRFNDVLSFRGIEGLSVRIDEGVKETEPKTFSSSDITLFAALQEAYKLWEVPFYFLGSEIVFGEGDIIPDVVFGYGADRELLSIGKTAQDSRIVTYSAGYGGAENIPYYYPNPTPMGTLKASYNGSEEAVEIKDQLKLYDAVGANGVLEYKGGIPYDKSQSFLIGNNPKVTSDVGSAMVEKILVASGWKYAFTADSRFSYEGGYKGKIGVNFSYEATYRGSENSLKANLPNGGFALKTPKEVEKDGFEFVIDKVGLSFRDRSSAISVLTYISVPYTTVYEVYAEGGENIPWRAPRRVKGVSVDLSVMTRFEGLTAADMILSVGGHFQTHVRWNEDNGKEAMFDMAFVGMSAVFSAGGWVVDGRSVGLTLDEVGLLTSQEPQIGDKIVVERVAYIRPSGKLMPSIYRESLGAQTGYPAKNDTYLLPEGEGYYHFDNLYDENRPQESVQEFEVVPSIEHLKDASGNALNVVKDVYFDTGYNTIDTVPSENGENRVLTFSEFYMKIGPLGFNLFDCALEGEEATILMLDGDCGACRFRILVTERGKNDVQVDENGDLVIGSDGKVKLNASSPQDRQNDTTSGEVWLRLALDDSTYGGGEFGVMPSYNAVTGVGQKPEAGDKIDFVGIRYPEELLRAAERELDAQIVKFMADNNAEKFAFNITFSSIYLAQNPSVRDMLSSRSALRLSYDDVELASPLYVQTYTRKVSAGEALPEITVALGEIIEMPTSGLTKRITAEVGSIIKTVQGAPGSVNTEAGGQRYLRKDREDSAELLTHFKKGLTVGEYIPGSGGRGGAIIPAADGDVLMEVDYLNVRKKATFTEVVIDRLKSVGGRLLLSLASMECRSVEYDEVNNGYKCYFEATNDSGVSISNEFVVGDLAICQSFDNNGSHYYWREVVAVGADYIVLSNAEGGYDEGSDAPEGGDTIVQLGHVSDASRQAAQILSCYGENTPSFVMYAGINSFSLEGRDIHGTIYRNNDGTYESYFFNFGSMLLGSRDENGDYIHFDAQQGLMTIKALLELKASQSLKGVQDYEDLKSALGEFSDALKGYEYLKEATNNGTLIAGGLVLTSLIQLGYKDGDIYRVLSGINGTIDENKGDKSIAAWFGGSMEDKENDADATDPAKSLFRHDGSGYFSNGNITWDKEGYGSIGGGLFSWGQDANGKKYIRISNEVTLGGDGDDSIETILAFISKVNSWFEEDSNGDIMVKNRGLYSPKFISSREADPNRGGGGTGGGSSYLNELLDVNANPIDLKTGDMLVWDKTSQKYIVINKSVFALASSLNDYQTKVSSSNKIPYTYISGVPTALKNPYALTIAGKAYDGSEEVSITAEDLGAITDLSDYYTKGEVDALIPSLAGYATEDWVKTQKYLTAITSAMVTSALGYTPYSSSNPNGYTSNKGTVTSVKMTVPTGFSVSGSPITSEGTLALSFASGYSLPTTAKQANWDAAYGWGNHASKGYATETFVNTAIANLINGAPTTLDTLKEIADALADNADVVEALESAIGTKADKTTVEALDARLDSAEANISTNTTTITAQGKTIASHTSSISTLSSDVSGLKTSVSDLEDLFDSDGKALKAVTADNATKLNGQAASYYATAASVTTLQGYFTNGVAKNADKLDGNDSTYFATASALTALTTRVSTAETNITNLTNNKLNKSVWDSVFEIDANGNLKVKVGLYSPKFISSREADPNTGGGSGGAFSLYTWTQVKALTSEVGGVAPTAYALKQAYNEIGVSLDGKASTSSVTALTTRVASLESKATSVSVSQTLTTGTEIGKITIDGVSKVLYAPSSIAWGSVTGKPSFATVATSGKYSDLSGLPTIPSIAGLASETWVTSNFLGLGGGTISGTSVAPLLINTSASDSSIVFRKDNVSKTQIGYNPSLGSFIYNYASQKSLGIKNDGTPHYSGNTLIHSGNANKTDVPWAASNILFPKGTSASWNVHSTDAYQGVTVLNAVQSKPEGAPDHYAVGLSVSGYYGFTLASLGGGDVLLYRRGSNSDWKTIAFTSDLENYLPLTGGTLTGDLKIQKADGDSTVHLGTKGLVYYNESILETVLYNGGDGYPAVKVKAGTAHPIFRYNYKDNVILHSGNIGSQIVEGITTHTGDATNANGDIAKLNSYYSSKGFRISRFNGLNGLGIANSDGLIVNWPLDHSYGQQWYMDDESHTIQVRYVANAVWSDWKTIAFTDSTVSAAKSVVDANGNALTLLHSGNYSDYALKLDGSNARATKLTSSESLDNYKYGFYSYTNGNNPTNSFGDNTALFAFSSNRGNDTWQVAFDGNGINNTAGPRIGIRGNYAGQGWISWKTIAFTDSDITGTANNANRLGGFEASVYPTFDNHGDRIGFNLHSNYISLGQGDGYIEFYDGGWYNSKWGKVTAINGFVGNLTGSATKLATPRTIWGQSFDGTGNVSGDLHLSESDIYWHRDKANYCIESVAQTGASPYLKIAHFGGIKFHTGALARMFITDGGNVLIGTTTDTGAKLQVNGKMSLYNSSTNAGYVEIRNARIGSGGHSDGLIRMFDTAGNSYGGIGIYGEGVPKFYYFGFGNYSSALNLRVHANGAVSIGYSTLADPTEKLAVNGNITATGTIYSATGVYSSGYVSARGADSSSDRRLKDNIAPLRNALNYVLGTNYVSFDWKDTREKSIGIIAQEEMGREWGCLVQKHSETYSYLYGQHTALLGAALQEEDKKVEELKRRIQDLENEVKRLKQTS